DNRAGRRPSVRARATEDRSARERVYSARTPRESRRLELSELRTSQMDGQSETAIALRATAQSCGDLGEHLQRPFEISGNLGCEDIGWRQRVRVCQALVLDPEQVEAQLVALEKVLQ